MEFRIITQHTVYPYEKYYPKLSRATITKTFPWQADTAEVTLTIGARIDGKSFISGMRTGDIIRVQANEDSRNRLYRWREIFSGIIKVMRAKSEATDNQITITAHGHGVELVNRLIKNSYSFADASTGLILKTILPELYRIHEQYPSLIDTNGTVLDSYNIEADTKYVKDVIKFLEKAELLTYSFKTIPIYDADNNLVDCVASWQPLPTTPTDKYKVVEGARNYVDSEFIVDVTEMARSVTVYGNDETVQKYARVTGGIGDKDILDIDRSIETNELCARLASSIFDIHQLPLVSGVCTLEMTTQAEAGDLVYCKVPSMVINGNTFGANLYVYRVTHEIDESGYKTRLELGSYIPTYGEILSFIENQMMAQKQNFIS